MSNSVTNPKALQLSAAQRESFQQNGYLHIPNPFNPHFLQSVRSRFDSLFSGDFQTGVYPDEWHWRKGISNENALREIVNCWKSDNTIRKLALDPSLGRLAADLMSWEGTRLGQDDILWKVPKTEIRQTEVIGSVVGVHRDSSYISTQFHPFENNSVTFWVPLDDSDRSNGVVEYFMGSHIKNENNTIKESFFTQQGQEPWHENDLDAKFNLTNLKVKVGDLVIHHQDTLHFSRENVSNRHRRAVGIHYLKEDISWRTDGKPVGYIYGKYVIKGETKPRDDFFPIVWSSHSCKL